MNYLKKIIIGLSIITVIGSVYGCSSSTKLAPDSNTTASPTATADVNTKENSPQYEDLSGDLKTYVNNRFKFTLQYPSDWQVKIDKPDINTATTGADISPTEGISFYFNTENESMKVFGQNGQIGGYVNNSFEKSSFPTKSGLTGDLYTSKKDGRVNIYLLLDKTESKYGFYVAHIDMSNENYAKYSKSLMGVLRSIKLIEDK